MAKEPIIIKGEFDLEALKTSIENVTDIEQAEAFFEQLTEVMRIKKELAAVADLLKPIEVEAKGLINAKAKALYGDDWKAIKGHGFKIVRSGTGAVFEITGSPVAKYVNIKKSVNGEAVKEFIARHDGKLPGGIEYSPSRGESIRITVVSNE